LVKVALHIDAGATWFRVKARRGWLVYDITDGMCEAPEFIEEGYWRAHALQNKYPEAVLIDHIRVTRSEFRRAVILRNQG
jgi:hypothetical protein